MINAPMRPLFGSLALLAAAAAASATASCGPDNACHSTRDTLAALDENCPADMPDPDAGSTACTPTQGTVCTVVGTGVAGLGMEGVAGTASKLYLPQDITMGPGGVAYFLDWNNHLIRTLDTSNVVRTAVGSGELSDADSTASSMPMRTPEPVLEARLNHPTNVAFDAAGNMFIAAWHNSSVKRVDASNPTMIVTDCGTGARGWGGDGMDAFNAVFNLPVGITIHPQTGDLYVADQANQRVRKVDHRTRIITTIAGTGTAGFAGDGGPATMAQLNGPVGQAATPAGRIVFDTTGNLYIADTGNHRVRKVSPEGIITTVAGTGVAGHAGDGGAATMAQLNGPTDVDVAPDGTLYIADTQNSCVRAVGTDGMIRTAVGRCGSRGFEGDGGPPTAARLDRPYGIETDPSGNLWIADTYNQRIRLLCASNTGRCAAPTSAPAP